jgi:hypothetical protein
MSDSLDQTRLDRLAAADQANLDGYQHGYDDGWADGRLAEQDRYDQLLDALRLILWHHHQHLAARDTSIQPAQVLGIYKHTVAHIRRAVGE